MELWHVSGSCSWRIEECCRTCFPGYPWHPLPSVCTVPGAGAASSRNSGEPWLPWYLQQFKEMSQSLQGVELRALRSFALCFFPRWLFPHCSGPSLAHLTPCPVCHLLNLLPPSLRAGLMDELGSAGSSPGQAHLQQVEGMLGRSESISSPLRAPGRAFGRAQRCPRCSWSRVWTLPLLNINCVPACVRRDGRSSADSSDKELAGLKDSI